MLDKLPLEIVDNIKTFIFTQCNECKKQLIYDEMLNNVTTVYYRSIFDDDFPFPRFHKIYKNICNSCIYNLKKEHIKPL